MISLGGLHLACQRIRVAEGFDAFTYLGHDDRVSFGHQRRRAFGRGEWVPWRVNARKWMNFQCQKISVALHKAAAFELALELGLLGARAAGAGGG